MKDIRYKDRYLVIGLNSEGATEGVQTKTKIAAYVVKIAMRIYKKYSNVKVITTAVCSAKNKRN